MFSERFRWIWKLPRWRPLRKRRMPRISRICGGLISLPVIAFLCFRLMVTDWQSLHGCLAGRSVSRRRTSRPRRKLLSSRHLSSFAGHIGSSIHRRNVSVHMLWEDWQSPKKRHYIKGQKSQFVTTMSTIGRQLRPRL